MRTKLTIRGIWLSATVIGLHWSSLAIVKNSLGQPTPCSYLTFQYKISSKAIIQPTKLVLHLQLAGMDRTKSRAESISFRRSTSSPKVDDPARTHPWILRPREIIGKMSGCSNAQLSRPLAIPDQYPIIIFTLTLWPNIYLKPTCRSFIPHQQVRQPPLFY